MKNSFNFIGGNMKVGKLILSLVLVAAVCSLAQAATKVLEWKFEGNLNDTSSSGINGVAYANTGAAALSYTTGVSGQAIVSDGNQSSYITGASTTVLPMKAADTWSVNFWVYPTTNPPRNWGLAYCLGNRPNSYDSFAAGTSRSIYSDNSYMVFTEGPDNNGGGSYVSTATKFDIGQWQMITTTYDGKRVRIYKNGLLIGSRANVVFLDAPGEVRMPAYAWGGYNFLAGKYDELTIWRGVLTQDEIVSMLIPGVVDYKAVDQQVFYKMGDPCESTMTMPDHSGYGNNGILYGYTNPLTNWVVNGARGDALYFGGGQDIDMTTTVSQNLQHSVTFWLKSGPQVYTTAFYYERNPAAGSTFCIRANNSNLQVYSLDYYWSTIYSVEVDASDYFDGVTWNHIAVVNDGDANTGKIYVNGELKLTANYLKADNKKPGMVGYIGYNSSENDLIESASIDDFKLWRGALTQEEIQAMAAAGNLDDDADVDFSDLDIFADTWLDNHLTTPGQIYQVDDMEGNITGWAQWTSETYSGTGVLSTTTNAYAGTGALQWDYNLPASGGNNYTSMYYDLGQEMNFSSYDKFEIALYRHRGNTPENLMYLKFYNGSMNVIAESWREYSNCVVEPNNAWEVWSIGLDSLLGEGGTGSKTSADLTNVRAILIGCGSWDKTAARKGTIDFDDAKFIKYPICSTKLDGDLDGDCKVNFYDFVIFADDWMLGK
jgi:hypothetical protein